MSDAPLSYAHHHVAQVIPPKTWTRIVFGGQTLIVPPRVGRALIWAELYGAWGIPGRPRRAKVRLVRQKPEGPDQTGLDALVIPSIGRRLEKVYAWAGYVQPTWPMTFEIWQDGRATLLNVAVKLDWFASSDEPLP